MELKQLKYIFDEIKSWDKDISSDMALDCGTRIFNSNNISKSNVKDVKEVKDSDQPKATDKQIYRLVNKHGVKEEVAEKLTKMEAMRIIQEKERN